jgi:membrane protein YqaA with SNARE-associated domain
MIHVYHYLLGCVVGFIFGGVIGYMIGEFRTNRKYQAGDEKTPY